MNVIGGSRGQLAAGVDPASPPLKVDGVPSAARKARGADVGGSGAGGGEEAAEVPVDVGPEGGGRGAAGGSRGGDSSAFI